MGWAETKMKVQQHLTGKKKEHLAQENFPLCKDNIEGDLQMEAFAALIADLKFKLSLFPANKGGIYRNIQCVLIFGQIEN